MGRKLLKGCGMIRRSQKYRLLGMTTWGVEQLCFWLQALVQIKLYRLSTSYVVSFADYEAVIPLLNLL